MANDLVTKAIPLCNRIGRNLIGHDFSLDYAQHLSFCPDVDIKKTKNEDRKITYSLKSGGTIEMVAQVTSIERVVAYFTNYPQSVYNELEAIEERIVDQENKSVQIK